MGFATGLIAGAILGEAANSSCGGQYANISTPPGVVWMYMACPVIVVFITAIYVAFKKPSLVMRRRDHALVGMLIGVGVWGFLLAIGYAVDYAHRAN